MVSGKRLSYHVHRRDPGMLGERVKQKEKHTIEEQMSSGTYAVNQYFTWRRL